MSFEGFSLEEAIAECFREAGLALDTGAIAGIALHAKEVLAANERLHLTTVVEPNAFVARHILESLIGAAALAPDVTGALVDLGSGNGYPGVPLALVHRGLRPALAESSGKKAAFLREIAKRLGWPAGTVLECTVRDAADLRGIAPIAVLASRAMGGWERLIPKLAPAMAPDGLILLWAGEGAEAVLRRTVWRRYDLERRVPLPGRDRSWIWCLRRGGPGPRP